MIAGEVSVTVDPETEATVARSGIPGPATPSPATIVPTGVAYPRDRVMGYPELLAMVMEMLPSEPFVLQGESFSSPLSIMIAAARPTGLRGLILSSAFARNPLVAPK